MARSPINLRLERAVALHQAGKLDEAERLYDQVLALDRSNPDALNLKGVIASSRNRFAEALALFDRAIAAVPNFPDMRFNRGLALAGLGRNEEALQAYTDALRLNPGYADARVNIGLLLHATGRNADAIAAFRTMTQVLPGDPRGFYNLGVCLDRSLPAAKEVERRAIGDEARAAYTRAAELDPNNPDIHFAFANLHSYFGEYSLAIERLKATLALKPKWTDEFRAQALSDLGEYLRKEKRPAEAVEYHRQALTLSPNNRIIKFNTATALADHQRADEAKEIYEGLSKSDPDFARALVNLANIYREEDRLDEAMELVERALEQEPSFQAYSNMAAIFVDKGWLATSLMAHDKAVALKRDDPKTLFNRAVALLTRGNFSLGWPDYDLRFRVPSEGTPGRPTPPPFWQGEDLAGKTLFIWTEQGLGDEAMYASIIPEIIDRPARCIIETSPRMTSVFARSFPQAEIVPRITFEQAQVVAARADVQISAASLGRYLRPDFASFPKHQGYLKADPKRRGELRRKYEQLANGRRIVGLAWKSKRKVYGARKSTTPLDLAPVLTLPGHVFVNLQYGDVAQDIATAREKLGVDVFQDPEIDSVTDIDGFFAQVAAMDCVITTSNTAVHVAGSMNVPTWLLLPHGKGGLWYWFLRRADCPWYPSVRILRGTGMDPDERWELDTSVRAAAELAQWAR